MEQKARIYWSYEKCKEEALKYNTKIEFLINSDGAYKHAYRNGFLNEICSHMKNIHWSYEKCKKEALKYKNKMEFIKNSNRAYQYAFKNNILNEICSHMINLKKPTGYWTKEKCHEESLKYKTTTEFYKNSKMAYKNSLKNGWLDEICSHLLETSHKKGYWTKEKCYEEALKYDTRKKFYKNSGTAYMTSAKNKWINEICSHMKEHKPSNYWNYENCLKEAINCETKIDFNKTKAYCMASKNKWLEKIYLYMNWEIIKRKRK